MNHVLTAPDPHRDNLEKTTTQSWWNLFADQWWWSYPREKTQEPTQATRGKECHAKIVLSHVTRQLALEALIGGCLQWAVCVISFWNNVFKEERKMYLALSGRLCI